MLERKQERRGFRVVPGSPIPAVVAGSDGKPMAAHINDISIGGAYLVIDDPVMAAGGLYVDERVTVAVEADRADGARRPFRRV